MRLWPGERPTWNRKDWKYSQSEAGFFAGSDVNSLRRKPGSVKPFQTAFAPRASHNQAVNIDSVFSRNCEMPIIGIDTNGLYTTQAGVARYVRGLLNALKRVAAPDVELQAVAWEVENFVYRQPERALKTVYRELIWARFNAPLHLRKHNVALLHSTAGPLISRPRGVREVVTLHDLAVLRHRERFRSWQGASARRRLRKVRRADQVICI